MDLCVIQSAVWFYKISAVGIAQLEKRAVKFSIINIKIIGY